MDELLTVAEVANILKTNTDYVYELNRSGMLRFIKVGRLKVRRKSLEEFMEHFEGWDVTNPSNPVEL